MQKVCLIRHLVREMWLENYRLEPLSQNLAILEDLIVGNIFGRV